MTLPFGLLSSEPVEDPKLEHSTNHVERAIAALIQILREVPRFTTLVQILVKPIQELEDVFWDLYTLRQLDTATGVQLDVIGGIVLEERAGLNDTDYRALLRIKIKVLLSKGTGPNLIEITQLFLGTNLFTYDESYPAAIQITVTDPAPTHDQLRLLLKFLRKTKSAGVKLDVVDAGSGLGTRFHYGSEGTGIGYGVGTYGSVL